jgi:hypothetical protein
VGSPGPAHCHGQGSGEKGRLARVPVLPDRGAAGRIMFPKIGSITLNFITFTVCCFTYSALKR